MAAAKKPCWSCRGEGTGTWCHLCANAAPRIDCFGVPIPEGKRGTWVQTYTGRKLWPLSPTAADIAIEDIAIGLARENRYGKQTMRPYKVAEHSVIVSLLVEEIAPEFAREALLHDCDEGPYPDWPRPLKHDPEMRLDQLREIGRLYQVAAFERFHIESTEQSHSVIDTIDKRLVVDEINQLMRNPEMYLERHGKVPPCGVTIQGLGEDQALELFLSRFAELFPEELTDDQCEHMKGVSGSCARCEGT